MGQILASLRYRVIQQLHPWIMCSVLPNRKKLARGDQAHCGLCGFVIADWKDGLCFDSAPAGHSN